MSGMNSLFAKMRETRMTAMNEENNKPETEEQVNESVQGEETAGATDNVTEPQGTPEEPEAPATSVEEETNEEVSAVFCKECGALVSGYMNESEVDECPCCGSEELLEKVVKVVRDGKVVTKKVATKKKRLSAAQKAALAKARKKAHSGAAEKQRAKSMKKARKLNDEDTIECPECGYSGDEEDYSVDEDGTLICPECGAIITESKQNEENKGSDKDDMKALLESVNAPKFVYDALEDGKEAFVTGYLNMKMGKSEE